MTAPARFTESALRRCVATGRCAVFSKRSFSRSAAHQKHGGLPKFYESSSPELHDVLMTIRSKILLPQHLNREQQRLVYRQENKSRLEQEPVVAQIGEVEATLEHIDRLKDVPRKWTMFKRLIELAKEPDDWENVLSILEGFRSARIKVPSSWQQKLVRRASQADMQYILLKAFERVERSGLSLGDRAVLERVFIGLRQYAQGGNLSGDFDQERAIRALTFTERVVDLMEWEEHCGGRHPSREDGRRRPFVTGTLLELAATREEPNADGKVATYSERLITILQQIQALESGVIDAELTTSATPRGKYKAEHLKHNVFLWLPVYRGLKLAQGILGPQLPQPEFTSRVISKLESSLEKAVSAVEAETPGHVAVKAWEMIRA